MLHSPWGVALSGTDPVMNDRLTYYTQETIQTWSVMPSRAMPSVASSRAANSRNAKLFSTFNCAAMTGGVAFRGTPELVIAVLKNSINSCCIALYCNRGLGYVRCQKRVRGTLRRPRHQVYCQRTAALPVGFVVDLQS